MGAPRFLGATAAIHVSPLSGGIGAGFIRHASEYKLLEITPVMDSMNYAAPVAGAVALVFAFVKAKWVSKQDPGTEDMVAIATEIRKGAMAFLSREYKVLALFVLVVAGLLAFAYSGSETQSPMIAVSYSKKPPELSSTRHANVWPCANSIRLSRTNFASTTSWQN